MTGIRRLVTRRLLGGVPVLVGITLYVFVILQLSSVDPRYASLGIYASDAQRAQFAQEFHLDDPLYVRYPRYLGDLIQGDLGVNSQGVPVDRLIGDAIPVTLSLALLSVTAGVLIAFVLGVSAAYYAGRRWDNIVRVVAFGGLALPTFWFALVLIQLLSLGAGLLPAGGYVPLTSSFSGWFQSLILPALTLAIPFGCFVTRVVRASVIDELDRDYVSTARGSGLSERRIVFVNVLRNALVAPLTVAGLQAGYILSGAVLVEVVFNMPGVGFLVWQAAQQGDLGVTAGVALFAAIVFVVINLLVDVLTFGVSPRAREV